MNEKKRPQKDLPDDVPVLVLGKDGTIQHMTPAAQALLAYEEPEEICFFSLVHGQNIYQVMRDVSEMVCYGKADVSWLLRLRTANSQWRWFEVFVDFRMKAGKASLRMVLQEA